MRNVLRYMILMAGLCMATNAFGAGPYFIDCAGGNDANNGTSISTPWQHHPYMVGATGNSAAYHHVAGDQFYFKGGVTCPNSFFPLTPQNGGSSLAAVDYYGPDPNKAWFVGVSWTRPIWDMQGQKAGTHNRILDGQTAIPSFLTIDNFEVKGFFWNDTCPTFGDDVMFNFHGSSSNITLNHMLIHQWTHTASPGAQDCAYVLLGNETSGDHTNTLENSTISCAVGDGTCTGDSSQDIRDWAIVHDCIIHDVPNGLVGFNEQFYNNQVYNINPSFDPLTHTNGYEAWSDDGTTSFIYNNVMHDTSSGSFAYDLNPPNYAGGGSVYFFNNVTYNVGSSNGPVLLDTDCEGITSCQPQNTSVFMYNNTFVGQNGTGQCVLIEGTPRGPAPFGKIDYRNNHCISASSPGWAINKSQTANAPSPSTPETVMSVATATADGYTAIEAFAYSPTSSTPKTGLTTIATGTNLASLCPASGNLAALCSDTTYGGTRTAVTRPPSSSGVNWDTGAFEFQTTPPPHALSTAPTATPH